MGFPRGWSRNPPVEGIRGARPVGPIIMVVAIVGGVPLLLIPGVGGDGLPDVTALTLLLLVSRRGDSPPAIADGPSRTTTSPIGGEELLEPILAFPCFQLLICL